jgi:hypothetical protein
MGLLEEQLSARCRRRRAALDRRLRGGDAQHGAAHALRRPRAGPAIAGRRRAGVPADGEAGQRTRSLPNRGRGGVARVSSPCPGR